MNFLNFIYNKLQENIWLYRQILLEIDSFVPITIPNLPYFDIIWRLATVNDLKKMASDGDMHIDMNNINYYNAISSDGNLMLVGEVDSKIIAYVCIVLGKKIFCKRYFKLLPNEGFVLACFTRTDWRGKGIGVRALAELRNSLLADIPSLHLFSHVNCSNTSSLRMFHKAGYVPAQTNLYRIRFFKWDVVFQSGKYKNRFIRDPKICQPEKYLINRSSQ